MKIAKSITTTLLISSLAFAVAPVNAATYSGKNHTNSNAQASNIDTTPSYIDMCDRWWMKPICKLN